MGEHSKRSEQAQVLRSKLLRRLALYIIIWTLSCAAAFSIVQLLSPDLGERIADETSSWYYFDTSEGLVEFQSNYPRDNNLQILVTDDGQYAVRDLSIYNTLRSLKIPVALLVYVIGIIFFVVRTLNRSLRYFDDLADAVSDPGLIDGKSVELPPELSIASRQLEALQENVREHEQSAVIAERRKNELVAYIAHDIRTPLTSVIGYLDLLVESPDLPIEKRAEYAGIALSKANKLESLVNEFFEITRYNLDSIVIERENVNMQLFLQQVADEFGLSAQERGISIDVEAPEDMSAFIDSSKMARAVGNILKNAIAYADPNTAVNVSAKSEDNNLVISISDKGREISKPHLERIFEQFFRGDSSRGQDGNAGLGLAIAKEIIDAHNGAISAESVDGITTFTMLIPLPKN